MSNPGTQDLTLPSKRSILVEVFPTEGAFDLGPEDCIGVRRVQRDGEAHQVESPVSAVGRPDRAGAATQPDPQAWGLPDPLLFPPPSWRAFYWLYKKFL